MRKIRPTPVGDAYRIGPGICRMLHANFQEVITGEVRRTPDFYVVGSIEAHQIHRKFIAVTKVGGNGGELAHDALKA
jgi:hypothetical protein